MKEVFPMYKKRGETPLEALERFRAENIEYADVPLTYAGRLDPAAHGVLLVLAGEVCKEKEEYLKLPKEYRADILLGITTDTYDLLGVVDEVRTLEAFDPEILLDIPEKFEGMRVWEYPPFSSKTVDGIPLWKLAREGKLSEIEIPEREMTFNSITCEEVRVVESMGVQKRVGELLTQISGDFRQQEIVESWSGIPARAFSVITLDIECESGTYIRSLAHKIGEEYGMGALLFDLERTWVGEWTI